MSRSFFFFYLNRFGLFLNRSLFFFSWKNWHGPLKPCKFPSFHFHSLSNSIFPVSNSVRERMAFASSKVFHLQSSSSSVSISPQKTQSLSGYCPKSTISFSSSIRCKFRLPKHPFHCQILIFFLHEVMVCFLFTLWIFAASPTNTFCKRNKRLSPLVASAGVRHLTGYLTRTEGLRFAVVSFPDTPIWGRLDFSY